MPGAGWARPAPMTTPAWRREWGKRLVLLKLRSQQQFLERAAEVRGDARLSLAQGHPLGAGDALGVGETAEADRPDLAGDSRVARCTGLFFRAGRRYFRPRSGFPDATGGLSRDPFNALLSLGYTLLHDEAVKAVNGWQVLDPYLGFYHQPVVWSRVARFRHDRAAAHPGGSALLGLVPRTTHHRQALHPGWRGLPVVQGWAALFLSALPLIEWVV